MLFFQGTVEMGLMVMGLISRIIEFVAHIARFGKIYECPSESSSPGGNGTGKRLKCNSGARGRNHHHNEVKRIKLLLDITVAKNGTQVLGIHASTPPGGTVFKSSGPGIIIRLLNIPSDIMLYFVAKMKQVAHYLKPAESPSCYESSRIKKSPKRRITRANYRKIIPFFPFNLLGFSNYSAFQMPSITHNGATTAEENNLNVSSISVNSKNRHKRRRDTSSSDDTSSLSDEDISYLGYPDKSNEDAVLLCSSGPTPRGHDEVDSDETADTVTKRGTSSSSSDNNPPSGSGTRIVVTLDASNSPGEGEGRHVSFIEELNEAANEAYNSEEDPDYIPPEYIPSSSSGSSFATDKGCTDEESFLVEKGFFPKANGKDHPESCFDEEPESKPEVENLEQEKVASPPKTNGNTTCDKTVSSSTETGTSESPAVTKQAPPTSAPNSSNKKNKNKNKKHNGAANNKNNQQQRKSQSNVPPNKLEPLVTAPSPDEDYKTPEEEENTQF